jgi:hypothetical protein
MPPRIPDFGKHFNPTEQTIDRIYFCFHSQHQRLHPF